MHIAQGPKPCAFDQAWQTHARKGLIYYTHNWPDKDVILDKLYKKSLEKLAID